MRHGSTYLAFVLGWVIVTFVVAFTRRMWQTRHDWWPRRRG